MIDILYHVLEFFIEAIILVVAIIATIGGSIAAASIQKQAHDKDEGMLHISSYNEKLDEMSDIFRQEVMEKDEYKAYLKEQKKQEKAQQKKAKETTPRYFLLQFKGDIAASQLTMLRKEIDVIIDNYQEGDEVLVNLESPGGYAHEYGLAASQLVRLREKHIPLTVLVDRVAASGGYMMACVANHIVAAPFAVIGSVGVYAGMPNFNRLLKKFDIDYEEMTAGKYKRTLTVLGENTEEGRKKFQEDIDNMHTLFRYHIAKYRPQLDVDMIATGETWHAIDALKIKLIDEINTSDTFIMDKMQKHEVFMMEYKFPKTAREKLGLAAHSMVDGCFNAVSNYVNKAKTLKKVA